MPSQLTDYQWDRIQEFLAGHPRVYVGNADQCRRFVEAVLWIVRIGAQWRFLPPEHGGWNTVYKRFQRWCDNGVWEAMHRNFSTDADMEHVTIDSAVVRAHACAAALMREAESGIREFPKWFWHQNLCDGRCAR